MTFWQQCGVAFLALFFTDIAWAFYVTAAKDGAPLRAAGWAVALFLLGGVAVISYTNNHLLLLPAAAGAFAGTWVGIWHSQKKETK